MQKERRMKTSWSETSTGSLCCFSGSPVGSNSCRLLKTYIFCNHFSSLSVFLFKCRSFTERSSRSGSIIDIRKPWWLSNNQLQPFAQFIQCNTVVPAADGRIWPQTHWIYSVYESNPRGAIQTAFQGDRRRLSKIWTSCRKAQTARRQRHVLLRS